MSLFQLIDGKPSSKWRVDNLKKELKKRDLDVSGFKNDLFKRLYLHEKTKKKQNKEKDNISDSSSLSKRESSSSDSNGESRDERSLPTSAAEEVNPGKETNDKTENLSRSPSLEKSDDESHINDHSTEDPGIQNLKGQFVINSIATCSNDHFSCPAL